MTKIFGATTTTDDVLEGVRLTNKRILVTGVSSGLGVETARSLKARGATVVGAARDLDKARQAMDHAGVNAAGAGVLELIHLDLASLKSVRRCADQLNSQGRPFDVVIANAGVMMCPAGTTEDGFETQFGTNHLGHFVLVNRIASQLRSDSRLITLSSGVHGLCDVDLDDPNFERAPYHELKAYARSKTASVLFAVEFDRRYRSRGIRAVAVHPGAIQTALTRHVTPQVSKRLSEESSNPTSPSPAIFWKTVQQGAATTVWAACVAPADVVGGRYCADCAVSGTAKERSIVGNDVQPYAMDPDRARALWNKSEEMVGERF